MTCSDAQNPPTFVRKQIKFQAVASDPDQDTTTLNFDWYTGSKDCSTVFEQPSAGAKPGQTSYPLLPTIPGAGCIGVVVTDQQGASATASVPFTVVNQPPVADVEIVSAAGIAPPQAGQPLMLPLYAKVTLTAAQSKDPEDDFTKLTFKWSVYSDTTLVPMPGCPDPTQEPYLCTFSTTTPGSYSVQLVVVDTSDKPSDPPAAQSIQVATDQLPNIVLDLVTPAPPFPPDEPPLELLASIDNTFTINQVQDDGDPYPSSDPASPYPTPPAGFVWFYQTGTDPSFKRLAKESGPSFTVRANTFVPQQAIRVRVEYHDRVTACQPKTAGCSAVFAACDPSATVCYSSDQRAQWVTWNVVFR